MMLRLGLSLLLASVAGTDALGAIRVVTYNVQCSGLGIIPPNPGFDTVMQAIGNHHMAGNAQPIDVLAQTKHRAAPIGWPSPCTRSGR